MRPDPVIMVVVMAHVMQSLMANDFALVCIPVLQQHQVMAHLQFVQLLHLQQLNHPHCDLP